MDILIACEESQAVCIEMRKKGHNAYSCDIQECSGGHPEWHIQGDVLPLLNGKCEFTTCDGTTHVVKRKMGFNYCTSAMYIFIKCWCGKIVSTKRDIKSRTLPKRIRSKKFLYEFL